MIRTSFLLVLMGTLLSFATGLSIANVAIDAVGVAIVLLGCVGVLGSLISAALADASVSAREPIAAD